MLSLLGKGGQRLVVIDFPEGDEIESGAGFGDGADGNSDSVSSATPPPSPFLGGDLSRSASSCSWASPDIPCQDGYISGLLNMHRNIA